MEACLDKKFLFLLLPEFMIESAILLSGNACLNGYQTLKERKNKTTRKEYGYKKEI